MASIFTHHLFGLRLKKGLDKSWQTVTDSPLFLYGQQGPDFFFFHRGLKVNGENPGTTIHDRSFMNYFMRNKALLSTLDEDDPALAYFFGTACHFILDAHIHPTVDRLETNRYRHMDIESELDRYFMLQEGHDPLRTPTATLLPESDCADVMAPFYEDYGVSQKDIETALRGFRFYKKLFYCPSPVKEKALVFLLTLTGHGEYAGQIMHHQPFSEATASNGLLAADFERALELAPALLENLREMIRGEQVKPDAWWLKNYNGRDAV